LKAGHVIHSGRLAPYRGKGAGTPLVYSPRRGVTRQVTGTTFLVCISAPASREYN